MAASSGSSSDSAVDAAKRRRVMQQLAACGSTRISLQDILCTLHATGCLETNFSKQLADRNKVQAAIRDAVVSSAQTPTPYGPIVKEFVIGSRTLSAVCPMAALWLRCKTSSSFSKILLHTLQLSDFKPLHVVVYMDEYQPGNPLRIDSSRSTQAVYWTFVEFPDWLLTRVDGWFVFCATRSTLVSELPGSVSEFAAGILKQMFTSPTANFIQGCICDFEHESRIVTGCFEGFVGDEKAHKEIFGIKGASGLRPCMTCKNVCRTLPVQDDDYLIDIGCSDYEKLDFHTDESIVEILDLLSELSTRKTKLAALEKNTGFKYCPTGLLFDSKLRAASLSQYSKWMIRDWMHTLVSHGVASTEIALLLRHLKTAHGIRFEELTSYSARCNLPRALPSPKKEWFTEDRLNEDKDDMRTPAASDHFPMAQILQLFLHELISPLNIMPDHIRCFDHLCEILSILQTGPSKAALHKILLQNEIRSHNSLFCDRYAESVKPKLHHLMHLPLDIARVGKSIGCFAMERKHISMKHCSQNKFRAYEAMVCRDIANHMLVDSKELRKEYLLNEHDVKSEDGTVHQIAKSARLACGEVRSEDLVLLQDGSVGVVECFFGCRLRGEIAVFLKMLLHEPDRHRFFWSITRASRFVNGDDVCRALTWSARETGFVVSTPKHEMYYN